MTRLKPNEHVLLDGIVGWRLDALQQTGIVETSPDGYLRLSPLPGSAKLIAGPQEQVRKATSLTVDREGRILVTDAAANDIRVLTANAATPIPAIGGPGKSARNLRSPHGIAALPNGALVVSDSGNDRVQLFSRAPYALLQVWDQGFKRPWGLAADPTGAVHIVDRGNHRIVRVRPDGDEWSEYGGDALHDPSLIACGPAGISAVVDGDGVAILPNGRRIDAVSSPRAVAFDADGILYVGDAAGVIYKFAADRNVAGRYKLVWYGAAGLEDEASVLDMVWDAALGLVILFKEPGDPVLRRVWTVDTAGSNVNQGVFVTKALDSGVERCAWHRIQLAANIPAGTSVVVETATSESGGLDPSTFSPCLLAGDDDPDGLVQSAAGRELWLRVTLRSDGRQSPVIRSVQAYFPRDSYLKFLPAVYQEDPDSRLFLDRFLSIFKTSNDAWDRTIDTLWQLFDPLATPKAFFPVLASWLALDVDPTWSDAKRRQMLKKAFATYSVRGTVAGLRQAIADYAGVPDAQIGEEFKLRAWASLQAGGPIGGGVRLFSRDIYGKLQLDAHSTIGDFRLNSAPEPGLEPLTWGAHRFRVFFPANPGDAEQVTERVREVVEREKPAHTEATYCPVLPRMRVGVQASLGVDARVGDISYMALSSGRVSNASTLNYDTILGCSRAEREVRALGTVPRPRVGLTAALL